jgi:putative transcriptional regulator
MTSKCRGLLQSLALLLTGACCLSPQSKRPEDLAVGKILVAPRDTHDPVFGESVILLVRYSEAGAVGLMMNRRTTVPISRALREVQGAAEHSDPVFAGGPVELSTVLSLARAPMKPEGAAEVFGHIYLIAARAALEKALGATTNPSGLRIYLGYCGWASGQLEYETRRGSWYIFNRSEDLTFDADPATLWKRLADRAEEQIVRLGFALPPHSD